MFSIDSRLKFALATVGLMVFAADRDTGAQQALTRKAVEQHVRALFSVWATGDPAKIIAAAEPPGAGFGFRTLAPRPNRPKNVQIEELRSFFNRVDYWRASLDELHTAVDGDVGLAWGFYTDDFKVRGQEPQKVRVRFTLTLKKDATGWRHLLFHRDAQQFDEKNSQAEQEVRQLENQLIEAQMRGDTTEFDRLLADDFTGTNAFGVVANKAEVLNLYRTGGIKRESVSLDDVNVRIHGDAAVVTGRAILKGEFTGQDTTGQFRYTRVYARRSEHWQVVAWQATRVAQR